MFVSAVILSITDAQSMSFTIAATELCIRRAVLIPDHVCPVQNVLVKLRSERSGNSTAVYAKYTQHARIARVA